MSEHEFRLDRERIRNQLLIARGDVRITTRRGRVLTVAADELDIGHGSVVVGFSGRFAYGGIAKVETI